MAKARPSFQHGFSLVELLVALVFTMVLMAGMANVYKASLSSFYTSGETLSNARRNRMSVDLLADDLNTACMYLADLSGTDKFSATTPPFFILPNMTVTGAGTSDPAVSDELYFYLDQPLSFEGVLQTVNTSAAEYVASGATPPANESLQIDCGSQTYARQVKAGQKMVLKDFYSPLTIVGTPEVSDKFVTVRTGADQDVGVTGVGSTGEPMSNKHLGSGANPRVLFLWPGQMVRYRIEMLDLDPSKPDGIPCLVRDQGTYNPAGFVPADPTSPAGITQQVVAENVSGFKVYLSTDGGATWAGLGASYSGFTAGWDQGIRAAVDAQLAVSGRPEVKTTRFSEDWFRSVPTLVRVDITTRTATQRAEYSPAGDQLAYRNLTQSLVFVPRHSGLTMN